MNLQNFKFRLTHYTLQCILNNSDTMEKLLFSKLCLKLFLWRLLPFLQCKNVTSLRNLVGWCHLRLYTKEVLWKKYLYLFIDLIIENDTFLRFESPEFQKRLSLHWFLWQAAAVISGNRNLNLQSFLVTDSDSDLTVSIRVNFLLGNKLLISGMIIKGMLFYYIAKIWCQQTDIAITRVI